MASEQASMPTFPDDVNDQWTSSTTSYYADENFSGVSEENVRSSPELESITHGPIWTPDVVQRVATLVPLMVATLLGNVVIVVVLSCNKRRKTNSRVNIFIVNLALGDLSVLCCTMTTEVGRPDQVWSSLFDAESLSCKTGLNSQVLLFHCDNIYECQVRRSINPVIYRF